MKPTRQLDSHVVRRMVVRTVRFRTGLQVFAFFEFEEVRVVLLLFPPVTILALVLVYTSFCIAHYEVVCFPVGTHFLHVTKNSWLSSIILPIMGVNADFAVMVVVSVRAPYSLEVVHVEIHVDDILFY